MQDVWGALLGYWGLGWVGGTRGTRSHCFNRGHHDLGLL